MAKPLTLDPDRLLSAEERSRAIVSDLYRAVVGLTIISPHRDSDPGWFATNAKWSNATELLLSDHYLYRMPCSQGVTLDELGVPGRAGRPATVAHAAWRTLAEHSHLFRGAPSAMWLTHVIGTSEWRGRKACRLDAPGSAPVRAAA